MFGPLKVSYILLGPSNYHFMLSANIFLYLKLFRRSVVIYDKDVGLI